MSNHYKILLLAVPLTIAIILIARSATSQSVPNPTSLQVLASQSGTYISYLSPNYYPKLDFNQLVSQSTDIITGTAGTNVCKLSADGTLITTEFQVTVQHVDKGRL